MSSLPSTLEEVQYEVLQGDLTANPKLQPSPIPAKDKELKTTAKKIIPAINELVKLVATCKQSVDTYAMQIEEKVSAYGEKLSEAIKEEQLKTLEEKLVSLDETVKGLVSEASEALKADYANVMEEKIKVLEGQIQALENVESAFKEALNETSEALKKDYANVMEEKISALEGQIQALVLKQIEEAGITTGTGGNELKREFISLTDLKENGTCRAPFKLQEVQDLSRQIEVLEYSSKYSAYIHIDTQYNLENSGTSIYEIYSRPLTLKVAEDGTITLVNTSLRKLKVYFYKLV